MKPITFFRFSEKKKLCILIGPSKGEQIILRFASFMSDEIEFRIMMTKARIFLLVDLQEFFFRFRVGRRKKINKKALKMVIFGAFFFF